MLSNRSADRWLRIVLYLRVSSLLKSLAKGGYKYSIGIILIDFGRKQVKTIDTNVYTYNKHVLKLYPLSSTASVVYEEEKEIVLIVSNR